MVDYRAQVRRGQPVGSLRQIAQYGVEILQAGALLQQVAQQAEDGGKALAQIGLEDVLG